MSLLRGTADLIFYPASSYDALMDKMRGLRAPDGWLERLHGGMVWTEPSPTDGVDAMIVNTMLARRHYRRPKLIDIRSSQVIVSVIAPLDHDLPVSGVPVKLEQQYILILPFGAIDELEHFGTGR